MAHVVTHVGTIPEETGTVTFELLEDGGTPGTDPLPLAAGANITWQEEGDPHDWTPILPASLILPLHDVAEEFQSRIFAGAEYQFQVRWKNAANAVQWTGFAVSDLFESSLNIFHRGANLQVQDALATLKGVRYDDGGTPFGDDSRVSFFQLIYDLLQLTGLSLGLRITCNTYPWRSTDPITGNPLEGVFVDRGIFTGYTKTGTPVAPYAWDVLWMVLQAWGLQLKQVAGIWFIQQRHTRAPGLTPTEYQYNAAGTLIGSAGNARIRYTWASPSEARDTIWAGQTRFTKHRPLLQASVRYNHGAIGANQIRHPSFEGDEAWVTSSSPLEWGQVTEASLIESFARSTGGPGGAYDGRETCAVIGRRYDNKDWNNIFRNNPPTSVAWPLAMAAVEALATRHLSYTGTEIEPSSTDRINVSVTAKWTSDDGRFLAASTPRPCWWGLQVGTKYLARAADGSLSWTDTPTKILFNQGVLSGGITPSWQTDTIDVLPDASGGVPILRLYNVVNHMILYNDGLAAWEADFDLWVHYDAIHFSAAADGSAISATEFITVNQSEGSKVLPAIDLPFGDGPNDYLKGRLTFADGLQTQAWKIGAYAPAEARYNTGAGNLTFSQLLAAMKVRMQSVAVEELTFDAKVATVGELSPIHVLENSGTGQRYVPAQVRRVFGMGEIGRVEGVYHELRLDAAWPSLEIREEEDRPRFVTAGDGAARVLGVRNRDLVNQLDVLPITNTTGVHLTADNPFLTLDVEAITDLRYLALKKGMSIMLMERRGRGQVFHQMRLRESVASGDVALLIEQLDNPGVGYSFDVNISPGSGIYAGDGSILGALGFTEHHLTSRFEAGAIGFLTGDISGPQTSLSLEADLGAANGIAYAVQDNREMILYPKGLNGVPVTPIKFFINNGAGYAIGASPITIDNGAGGPVTISALAGSVVHFSGGAIGTLVGQNAQQILLRAYETDVRETIFEARGAVFAKITSAALSTSDTIAIEPAPGPLPAGGKVRIIYRDTLFVGGSSTPLFKILDRVLLNAVTAGQQSMKFTTTHGVALAFGDHVYYQSGEITTRLTDNAAEIVVQKGRIDARVSSRDAVKNLTLSQNYGTATTETSGTTILQITPEASEVTKKLYIGDTLILEGFPGTVNAQQYRITLAADRTLTAGPQNITINSQNLKGQTGDPLYRGTLAALRLDLGGISVDAAKLESQNAVGYTIVAGLITVPPTAGWLLTDQGDLGLAGSVYLGGSGKVTNAAGDFKVNPSGFETLENIASGGADPNRSYKIKTAAGVAVARLSAHNFSGAQQVTLESKEGRILALNSDAELILTAQDSDIIISSVGLFDISITGGNIDLTAPGGTTVSADLIVEGEILVGAAGTPAAASVLEVRSTTGAFMLPRMTTTQRNAFTGLQGMMIYNTTAGNPQYHTGSGWIDI